MDRHIVFKCPRTGLNVQHRLAEDVPDDRKNAYTSVVCPACANLHLVHSSTGKLLGETKKT
jgi:predicted RNA-binding Zn-ribbon protein involved in translation (DUF1610 family)